jgi:hypothetical protein
MKKVERLTFHFNKILKYLKSGNTFHEENKSFVQPSNGMCKPQRDCLTEYMESFN